jgi:hypothetical protein
MDLFKKIKWWHLHYWRPLSVSIYKKLTFRRFFKVTFIIIPMVNQKDVQKSHSLYLKHKFLRVKKLVIIFKLFNTLPKLTPFTDDQNDCYQFYWEFLFSISYKHLISKKSKTDSQSFVYKMTSFMMRFFSLQEIPTFLATFTLLGRPTKDIYYIYCILTH